MRDPDHEKQIKPNLFLLITRSATNANTAELMPMKRGCIHILVVPRIQILELPLVRARNN